MCSSQHLWMADILDGSASKLEEYKVSCSSSWPSWLLPWVFWTTKGYCSRLPYRRSASWSRWIWTNAKGHACTSENTTAADINSYIKAIRRSRTQLLTSNNSRESASFWRTSPVPFTLFLALIENIKVQGWEGSGFTIDKTELGRVGTRRWNPYSSATHFSSQAPMWLKALHLHSSDYSSICSIA